MSIQAELASLQRIGDRLISTTNDDLEKVLEVLLPKLLPLSNNGALRDKQVVPILMHILRRIKPLETRLPLQALIGLIQPEMMPFCCNLTMVFIDATVKWHPAELYKDCALPLIHNLFKFQPFSSQSNALCFYSLPCISFLSVQTAPDVEENVKIILGDWLLDLSIAQPGIIKGSAGSIQPGLSADRLARLTSKKAAWMAVDMRQPKLDLIHSISKQWLPTNCAVAIAIICSCDADSDVATQAVFKMSGARSILPDINVNPLPVLELLLTLCLPLTQAMLKYEQNTYVRQRTTLRNSVTCAIVRWICKEMQDHLTLAAKNIVELVISEILKSNEGGSVDSTYISIIMELTALLVERLNDEALVSAAPLLLLCAKKALVPFVSLLSSHSISSVDSEAGIHTRECCYRVIDRISRKCPLIAVLDTELLVLLFRLLDCEILISSTLAFASDKDNRAVIRLYTALGGLRIAYSVVNDTVMTSTIGKVNGTGTGTGGSSRSSLAELISRSRTSSEPKKRLASVQWARALFMWDPLVLETLMLLADDPNESVSQAVAAELVALRKILNGDESKERQGRIDDQQREGTPNVDAVIPVDCDTNEKDIEISDCNTILLDVLDLLTSSLVFYPFGSTVGGSEDVFTISDVHVLPVLNSPSKINETDRNSEGVRTLRPIACEEFLHSAAIGVRRLVYTTLKYDFNEHSFLATDSWPNISTASVDDISNISTIRPPQLCRVMVAISDIFASISLTKNKSISSSIETGAARSRTALKDALHNSQSRGILAAGIDLLHKCLQLKCDVEVLECSRSLLTSVLPWLSMCYSDPTDPFSLTSLSYDVSNSINGSVKIPDVSSTSSSDNTSGRQITSGRKVGCLRVHLSQIIALTCKNADQNYISNLYRILGHKLTQLPIPSSTFSMISDDTDNIIVSLNEDDQILISGVITALGSITVALTAWKSSSINCDGNSIVNRQYQSSLIEKECNSLLNIINVILKFVTKKSDKISVSVTSLPLTEAAPLRVQFIELRIVALRVLRDIASSALLRSSTDNTKCSLAALVSIIRSYDQDEAVKPCNGARNGRSSGLSMVVAAAIDALSTVCVSGVKEDFFWSVWELLLSLRLARSETPLLRFALAEGLVRMSAVRLFLVPTSPMVIPVCSDSLTHIIPEGNSSRESTESIATIVGKNCQIEDKFPVLMRVLLGIIETVVAGGPVISMRTGEAPVIADSGSSLKAIFDKSTAGVLLLVLVKQSARQSHSNSAFCSINAVSSSLKRTADDTSSEYAQLQALPRKEIIRATELFLHLLREKDAFLQDMSCAGLCYLFDSATQADKAITPVDSLLSGAAAAKITLSGIIGREVIATLTREKRAAQTAGVAVAGESTSTSMEGDMARALEAALNPSTTEDNGDARRGGTDNRGGNGGRGGGGGGAVAGGGGGAPAPVDPLAAATAAAAIELGLSPDATAALTRVSQNRDTTNDNGFGVYTTACKVAKKTGDSSVVFAVLSLIQRDPSFGVGETSNLRYIYRAPITHIEKDKIKDLIPSLFLAKYDPSPPVKALMRQLWETLVTAQGLQKLLPNLQGAVIKYLCLCLSSKQWRDREASCAALEAFLPLRPWSVVRNIGDELWQSGMSVLDDIRDSTRLAAVGYMKVLSDQVLRACNPEESGTCSVIVDDAVSFIMPILLDKGLLAPSPEGRGFTLGVLVKLIKSSRAALKEWLVRLVAVLVESMSALEPKTLQYMQFHTARLHINDEELENMRVRLSRQSPMQEALDACLQALGGRPNDVPEAARALRSQLQSGVGLATRVGAVQSLSYLADTHPGELGATDHGSKAFRTIVDSLIQSPQMAVTLKKALLGGVGSLAKVVNGNVLACVTEDLVTRYEVLGRDDCSEAPIIASCLLQLISRAGDRLLDDCAWNRLLACSYIGGYDTNPEAQEVWAKLWPEVLSGCATGTKISALLRVLPIIVKLVCTLLLDLSWNKRKQAVAVLSDLIVSLNSKELSPYMGGMVESLLRSIPGQIWNGQAQAIETLAMVINKCFQTDNIDLKMSKDNLLCQRTCKNKNEENTFSDENKTNEFDDEIIFTLMDAKIKKLILPTAESLILNTTAIAINMELNSSSYIQSNQNQFISPNDKFDKNKTWIVSLKGLINLLLHETSRGDRDYRLSAAKALSLLPWINITLSLEGQEIFSSFVGEFARLGGVIAPAVGPTNLTSGDGVPVRIDDSKIIGSNEREGNDDLKGEIRRKQQTNTAMFGSRYGIEFKEVKSSSLRRRNPITATSSSVTSSSAVNILQHSSNAERDLLIERNTIDTTHMIDNSSQMHIATDLDTMELENADAVTAVSIGDVFVNVEVEEGNRNGHEIAVQSLSSHGIIGSGSQSSDPAFRVKMLHCISTGWPVKTLIVSKLTTQCDNLDADYLISWAIGIGESGEVWSIRVAALQLLGAVLSARQREEEKGVGNSDVSIFLSAIRAITIGMADRKYSKVRVAALICLNKLLNALHCSHCLVDREEVRIVLRLAASDPEPIVLEAASKAQKSWLSLNVSKDTTVNT